MSDVAKVLFTITTTLLPRLILSLFYIYSDLYRERINIYLNLNVKDSIKPGDEAAITTYSLTHKSKVRGRNVSGEFMPLVKANAMSIIL